MVGVRTLMLPVAHPTGRPPSLASDGRPRQASHRISKRTEPDARDGALKLKPR